MPKGRVENLHVPTSDEAREIGRKGGIASGIARKKKKEKRQFIKDVLDNSIGAKQRKAAQSILGALDEDEATVFAMCTAGMVKAAINGNTRAFELLMEFADEADDVSVETMDALSASLEELAGEL